MKKIILTATIAVLLSFGLAACSGGSGAGTASTASSGVSGEASAPSESASSAAQTASAAAAPASSSATATPAASGASAASGGAAAPSATADGKQTATGTVVTTTYKDRAAEVGLTGDDYANDTGLLTLLVLDEPIQVTAYKGGSDYTGAASVICLPNDEMFRQFSGKQITVSVDSWGEWPADLKGGFTGWQNATTGDNLTVRSVDDELVKEDGYGSATEKGALAEGYVRITTHAYTLETTDDLAAVRDAMLAGCTVEDSWQAGFGAYLYSVVVDASGERYVIVVIANDENEAQVEFKTDAYLEASGDGGVDGYVDSWKN